MSDDKTKAPMDASATERKVGIAATNNKRVCGAIKQLTKEVHSLFPETPVEHSNYDGRNTALDVVFDLSVLDDPDADTFAAMLSLYDLDSDPRIDYVLVGTDTKSVLVSMKSNPRTQDTRDEFGLADAYSVLTEDDGLGSLTGVFSLDADGSL